MGPDDLQALAGLLVETCGGEPGFASGGSTMDRVRRVLLVGDQPLPLEAIAARTGLDHHELRRKLRQHTGIWLATVP